MSKDSNTILKKAARSLLDRWKKVLIVYSALLIICVFTSPLVKVIDSLDYYLPDETETRQGLDINDNVFYTFGTARVMLTNISYAQAEELCEDIKTIEGVKDVEFDDSQDHMRNGNYLMNVIFKGTKDDEISISALHDLESKLEAYDSYLDTKVGNPLKTIVGKEMIVVDIIAFGIIIIVLLLTSNTYGEIPVLLLTFGVAALLNMGTNFIAGEISFVTDSIAVVLQLALAMDYAIILCHRYQEEHDQNGKDPKEAIIDAITSAIPEISASSLTTVSGLLALGFMEYKLGLDMSVILIKAILISMICVFTFMPIMLLIFSGLMDKSHHKSLMPKMSFLGKYAYLTRKIIPPVFLVLFVLGVVFSSKANFVYDQYSIESIRKNDIQIAEKKIKEVFGVRNELAVIIPTGDSDSERKAIGELKELDHVIEVIGLSDIEAIDGYKLLDEVNPRQFSEILDIDYETSELIFAGYAMENDQYGHAITGMETYTVPLLDILDYVIDRKDDVTIEIDQDKLDDIDDLKKELDDGKLQMQSDLWSRIVVILDTETEDDTSFEYLNIIKGIFAKYYSRYFVVGTTTSCLDLGTSFKEDNKLITILSTAFVFVVLMLTYKSVGLPVLLILLIQGSVNLNFASPYLTGNSLFFLTYLIITAIQMGANIDYAIVISGRYLENRKTLEPREAMISSMAEAFPTVFSSGTMLTCAGIIIGLMTSNESISSVGVFLGKGTLVSMILVLGFLPQILLLGDKLILSTSFSLSDASSSVQHLGKIRLDGHVKGYVNGYIDAEIKGIFKGEIKAQMSLDSFEDDGSDQIEE